MSAQSALTGVAPRRRRLARPHRAMGHRPAVGHRVCGTLPANRSRARARVRLLPSASGLRRAKAQEEREEREGSAKTTQ